MTNELAQRLILRGATSGPQLPEAVFGTAGSLRASLQLGQASIRLGLWPILGEQSPQTAMGLLVLLGYLLEQNQSIRVYLLMTRVGESPDDYVWRIADSQFNAEEWSLDDLNENAGLWGSLEQSASGWKLSLEIEQDSHDPELQTFAFQSTSLAELVGKLPAIAAELAAFLLDEQVESLVPVYDPDPSWDGEWIEKLLRAVFEWELHLYLHLWGKTWAEPDTKAEAERLIELGQRFGELGAWTLAQSAARLITFLDPAEAVFIWPILDQIISTFSSSPIPPIILAKALFEAQQIEAAYELLNTYLEGTADVEVYLTQAELYRRGGRFEDSIDAYHDAIEEEIVNSRLYLQYANLMIVLEYNRIPVETVILVDPDEVPEHTALWEAVESYQEVLKLEPENQIALSRQLLQLIDLDPEDGRIWSNFEMLVRLDRQNQYLAQIIDALYSVENLSPGIRILKSAVVAESDRLDLKLNIAALYVLDEDSEAARRILQPIKNQSVNEEYLPEIERLSLLAEDPEFEARLSELADIVNAGNDLDTEDVDFLESVITKAPRFADGYIILAKAYENWEEIPTAVDTLLDAHRHLQDDPDIMALLSEMLWKSGEQDLAFSYLKKGLTASPNHVPLLALSGQYLYEDGQLDAARVYLARAEAISPQNPALVKARRYIASLM